MGITAQKITAVSWIGLGVVAVIAAALARADDTHPSTLRAAQNSSGKTTRQSDAPRTGSVRIPQSGVAPFMVQDTMTDSPGTNNVTRIVTLTAQIGGSPALQWQVDHGQGFTAIAGATNATLRIGNAQVEDSGRYALFATNSAGRLHTTPVPVIVTEVED